MRSTLGLASGKWHVQLTLHGPGNTTSFRMGFATVDHDIALSLGDTIGQSWAIGANANPRHDAGWDTDLGDSYADGDAVDLFVDIDAGRIWYGIAGAPWSGDPAAGTGEHHSFTPGTTLFVAGSRNSNANTTRSATLRLLAEYEGTSPSGFARGWGASAAGGHGWAVLGWAVDAAVATRATAAGLLRTLLADRLGFRHVEAGPAVLVSIAADAATRTFTAGGGSFAGLGIQPGDQVSLAGTSLNAGINFTVAAVGTLTLQVREPIADMAAETGFVLSTGDLDAPALAALAAAAPAPLGAWLGEESPTGRDLVDRINATVGAWIDTDPAGLLTFGRYAGPAAEADHRLDERHCTAVRRLPVGTALWRRRIGAERCWRVHGAAEIAAAVPDAVRRFLLSEWREGFDEAPAVQQDDLGADEAFVEGLFARRPDATAEAARQLALLSPAALAFEVEASMVALTWRLGRTVALTAPEVGLAAPRRLVIVARELRLEADTVTLTLLG
ncbi:hypothetical protein STVA_41360 [Allostella vacuolata]|nr:hypothetical protein STVA_41360 [Stella vacuolata]